MRQATLIDSIKERAYHNPQHRTLVFVNDDGTEEQISADELLRNTVNYAQALHSIGIKPDDLVILVLQHSPKLVYAFWGSIYLGAIPSILPFLTEKLDPVIYMEQVRMLVKHSGAQVVISFPEFAAELRGVLGEIDCQVLSTDAVLVYEADSAKLPVWTDFSKDKLAFLQHSSGTTGLQKGVAISHQAVLNQLESYSKAIDLNSNDVIVSWLPLYHDMGLIAGFVMPLVLGVPLVLISPFHWVRDPKTLLWAIHKHKGTLSWLPNFAYNHSVRSIRSQDLIGLDLSSWRGVINSSEPVRYDSHQLFLDRFNPYGLQANSLATCYAMAENTFAVTQSSIGRPPHIDWVNLKHLQENGRAVELLPNDPRATPVVSCGSTIKDTEVAVANENGHVLPERHIGEVIIRGSSMMSEYFRQPDLSAQAIRNGWYITGDMGYLSDGHLYITGRKKDLIIVGGKNIYPQDLEAIANQIPGIYPGRAVAFGLMDERLGSEGIVMVCELQGSQNNDTIQIERELRYQIVRQMDITLADVKLVEKRWLVKTSSGKITRTTNRDKYVHEFSYNNN